MILKKFEYIRKAGPREDWKIENLYLDRNNLLVGKNASGKTNTLIFIILLGNLLKGNYPSTGAMECKAEFSIKDDSLTYILKKNKNEEIIKETLLRNKEELIKRDSKGNRIYSEKSKKLQTFKPSKNKLTVEVRRNEEEYPYLEKLIEWGEHLYAFSFGAIPLYQQLNVPGYNIYFENLDKMLDILEKDAEKKELKKHVISDLNFIDYEIEDYHFLPGHFQSIKKHKIAIHEKGFDIPISQYLMSAGMFRAFSILVIINHYLLSKKPCTLIIDDLGEGLDFKRSSKLTELLFDKVKDSKIQLIVTSNDRFLMNAVDLKYWNILDRKKHIVTSYNYKNSKETFEEFKFTKLSNFDFFASEFYKEEGE